MRKTLQILIFYILSLSFIPCVQAQELVFKKYSIQEGLSCNETYGVAQDTNGYMWIASEMGLQKFDGTHFVNTNTDVLGNVSIVRLKLDHQGRMWCASIDNQLARLQNDALIPQSLEGY